jgi:hypothetical protein
VSLLFEWLRRGELGKGLKGSGKKMSEEWGRVGGEE